MQPCVKATAVNKTFASSVETLRLPFIGACNPAPAFLFFSQIISFNWPFICHYLIVSAVQAKALFHF